MKQPIEKPAGKKTRFGDRLNQLVNNLSINVTDVWGLEKKIHKSIREYFIKISEQENVTMDQLCVIIRIKNDHLKIWLLISQTTLRPLAITELLNAFGMPTINPGVMEDKIRKFLHQHAIPFHQVSIIISSDQKAMVRLYQDVDLICNIPMREMLNHFLL